MSFATEAEIAMYEKAMDFEDDDEINCTDCGHTTDWKEVKSIFRSGGPTSCPECGTVGSFKNEGKGIKHLLDSFKEKIK